MAPQKKTLSEKTVLPGLFEAFSFVGTFVEEIAPGLKNRPHLSF
jgi:hypothetical protein